MHIAIRLLILNAFVWAVAEETRYDAIDRQLHQANADARAQPTTHTHTTNAAYHCRTRAARSLSPARGVLAASYRTLCFNDAARCSVLACELCPNCHMWPISPLLLLRSPTTTCTCPLRLKQASLRRTNPLLGPSQPSPIPPPSRTLFRCRYRSRAESTAGSSFRRTGAQAADSAAATPEAGLAEDTGAILATRSTLAEAACAPQATASPTPSAEEPAPPPSPSSEEIHCPPRHSAEGNPPPPHDPQPLKPTGGAAGRFMTGRPLYAPDIPSPAGCHAPPPRSASARPPSRYRLSCCPTCP